MIQVSCAIILGDRKFLAVQRGPRSSHPGQWEFPGGKIHRGETAEDCIVREINEELCVKVEIIVRLTPVEYDYGNRQIYLIPFVCRIVSGAIVLTEHVAQRWIGADQWPTLDWSGADRELIVRNPGLIDKFISPGSEK